METFEESMRNYRQQLEKGSIQRAYRGLMDFMSAMKTRFKEKYPQYRVSGSLYSGYMDMTYFSCIPPALEQRGLKIAVVFLHEPFRFEVWLSGVNRQVQAEYWEMFRQHDWGAYRLVKNPKTADAILESVAAAA
ncbi:MAG: hypothetical protein AAGU05_04515, partial [Anaerolineaceae bacterium]